eukprot:805365-Prymnesium_polylepis.1
MAVGGVARRAAAGLAARSARDRWAGAAAAAAGVSGWSGSAGSGEPLLATACWSSTATAGLIDEKAAQEAPPPAARARRQALPW